MSDDEDDQQHGQYIGPFDAKVDDPDQPTNKTWKQLLMLSEEDRFKELMKRFRETHKKNRYINNVHIENHLSPIVEHIPRLSYKNPDMMVAGYAVLQQKQIVPSILKDLVTYLEKETDQINIRSNIIRYARLIMNYM